MRSFTKKARKTGGNMVITIPSETVEAERIEEGDLLDIKISLVNPKPKNKAFKKDKIIKDKYKTPEELIQSVPKALKILLKDYTERWVSSGEILDCIKANKLCEIGKFKFKNIYIEIGDILVSLGYIETKRISGIKYRFISMESLNKRGNK